MLKPIKLTESWEHENAIMENHIKQKAVAGAISQILEAGCGQKWDLNLDGMEYFITGVDLDKAALDIRKSTRNDLHQGIKGDLRTVELQDEQYDVIYSSFVLEHIEGSEKVLEKFVKWLRPAGIIVLRVPDPYSAQGFLTRITPHWFHVFYYRYILRISNAGKPGYVPYPVHYDYVITRRGLREFCAKNNLTVLAEYGDGYVRPGSGGVKWLVHSFKQAVCLLSFGLLSAKHTNLLYILQK